MYAEDVELSYRFRAFGYVLKYIPRAVVNCFVCDAADQVKPLQYPNSYLGNLYLRLRYGNYRDRIIGHMMYGAKLFRSPLFDGAKGIVIKNWVRVFNTGTQLIKQNRAKYIYYPFYGLNYEIMRDGLLFETKIINNDRSYPVVTVITRTYHGRGFFLAQAIQSVFNQTYPNIELIVVQDGGSTQQLIISKMLFRAPKSCTIKFIVNEKLGRSAAGNSGLEAASGEFIVFLDDDDLLFSDHIETHMSILLNDNSISASYSVAMEVYTRLDPKVGYVEESFHTPDSFRQVWDYSILRHHNFIPIQSLLFRRDLFDCRGGFDLSLDQLEDWNLWLRYGYGNSFSYIPKTTSLFRVPADPKVRALRHVGIDSAYSFAKQKAEEAIKLY
jgi:GT2 family glycosyltransferase